DNSIDDGAAGEGAAGSGRRDGGAAAKDRRRILDRHADGDPRGEVLHRADLPLSRVVEPNDVVRIDRERDVFLAWRHVNLVLRQQAPGLAGEEVKSPTGIVVGEIGMAKPRSPAVALVVIGRHADAQEVALIEPGDLLVRVDLALDEQRDPALPGASVKLMLVKERRERERNRGERRPHIIHRVALTPY